MLSRLKVSHILRVNPSFLHTLINSMIISFRLLIGLGRRHQVTAIISVARIGDYPA